MVIRDEKGRFIKGYHYSPRTEFIKGQHWRLKQPYWDYSWLYHEYVENRKTVPDIAKEWSVTNAAIYFWLRKFGIPRRTISEARQIKHWGLSGENNGMYGKKGEKSPNWKGGVTPERQAFYASPEWARAVRYVWKRDAGYCQRCHRKSRKVPSNFHIHHRITFGIKDIRANIDNLVLLCPKCHYWVHSKLNTKGEFLGAFQITMKGGDETGGEIL
jgi:hypothetical protein